MTFTAFTLAGADAFRPTAPAAATRPIRASAKSGRRWTLGDLLHGLLEAVLVSPMDSVPRLRSYPY